MAVLIDSDKYKLKINNKDIQVLINNEEVFEFDNRPFIFPNVKYGDEAFVFTVDILGGDLNFYIPLNGYGIINTQNAPYNWVIEWGDGIIETKSGISSSLDTNYIQHNYLTSGTYKIIIKPVINDYQWMRAFGFLTGTTGNANIVTNKNKMISFDYITNKSFMQSSTSYGDYYLRQLATGTNIIYPANEVKTVSEDNIITISNFFKCQQYFKCKNLILTEIEWLPDSIKIINNSFRYQQYAECNNLQYIINEYLSNNITNIGDNFRYQQYCGYFIPPTFTVTFDAPNEVMPNTVISIGNSFRYEQYRDSQCKNASLNEAFSINIKGTTGDNFRYQQYYNCTKLIGSTPNEVLPNVTFININFRRNQYGMTNIVLCGNEFIPNTVTTIGDNFRYQQYFACRQLNGPAIESLSNIVTKLGNYFRYRQYDMNYINFKYTTPEILPNSVTTIGTYFRGNQYSDCYGLTQTTPEILPDSVINIGDSFRYRQYYGCTNLKIGNHIHCKKFNILLNISNNNYVQMFSSNNNIIDTIPKYIDSNNIQQFITNLTPSVRKQYCEGRIGISGYASLHANWK